MKRTVGVAGMRFCWHPETGTHMVDDIVMPAPTDEAVALGIPVWTGCKVLEADEVVGYGQSASSYDSRYFGPVQTSRLLGVYRPIWTVN
jgi:type IV secretory pathway protease TraF